ncbi:MAG: sialate O-acetylesterase [Chitinophagaceae bacterium]
MSTKLNFLLAFILFFAPAHAVIRLPALISDNMILQQNSTVKLWGWANSGERVSVAASWIKKPLMTTANPDGTWEVSIVTTKAGGPYTITFSGSNTIEVKNVLLGEVWLASGQSNMEFFLGRKGSTGYTGAIDYENEIRNANYPFIRTIDIPNRVSDDPQNDFRGEWKMCSPQTADTFSAVAFYFAKSVNAATGYPVGIINATWGGTPAESWTRKEVLENDTSLVHIMERYKKQCEDYPAAYEKFKAELDKWKADTSKTKPAAPREPMGPKHSNSPYKLYNGMIAPVLPYTIKGAIWYQGEGNAGRAAQYHRLFPAMINNWREDFHNPKMPFYFVQIAPHKGQNPEIREAQFYTLRHVPYTGMAVITDQGDSLDIHPRFKKPVGERLAFWALKNEYGKKNIVVSGPLYSSMKVEGNKIRINFDYADGLTAKDGDLKEFTIADESGNFVPATAKIEGKTILVWSDAIAKPVAVRFAYKNVPEPNLFNGAGLPASPFRTDNYPLTTAGRY